MQKGFASVRFDFRGCGLSNGDFWRSTISKRVDDVKAIIEVVRDIYPQLPLTLVGFSDGCRVALESLSISGITSLVLWSPILQLESGTDVIDSHWIRHPRDRTPVKPFLGHWVGFQYVRESMKPVKLTNKEIPVLMITGGVDLDVRDSLELLKSQFIYYQHEEIEHAGHLYASPAHESILLELTGKWLINQYS